MRNNKIIKWFLQHSLTIASCVLITGLGIAFLVWSSPNTTTIGENISTGNITASGDVAVSGSLEAKTGRTATLVVAATDSLTTSKAQADYVCDGVNDQIEIQAALDALPAAGGEVKLLDGTYNCEATINLDYNQTLRGCGRNTILTTSTAGLIFLSAVGIAGTEKTGIVIADLQIDGGADFVSDCGIYFEYVDYSFIQNVYSRRHGNGSYLMGIYLLNSDFNTIMSNACQENGNYGIYLVASSSNTVSGNACQGNSDGIHLYTSNNNTITGNTCQGSDSDGIDLEASNNNTISGNTCQGNASTGIYLLNSSNNNTVTGNTCQGNGYSGIWLENSSNNNTISGNTCQGNASTGISLWTSSSNNTVVGNTCIANSQDTTNTYDDIQVTGDSDYNNIQGNTCRAGALGNVPRYGINIATADCDGNLVTNNDLYNDGFGTAPFNDAGTGTVTAAGNRQ